MLEPIRNWWCHKVLPLVYTDALSYYEMLGKFVSKLNELITNVNSLNENTVFSVNNVKPVNGNVTIDASSFEGFVSGVNGKKPDSAGEVTLTAEDVGALPDTTVVVSSVNGIAPIGGNVNVGTVKSVNGSMPDASGNVNLPQVSGVTSVDGVGADSSGNVPLNAVKSVNGKKPDSAGEVTLTAEDVGALPDTTVVVSSVNGIAPTDGNVNVGTVKSVNSKTPDNAGNVDVGTVKSINTTIIPDAAGNISLSADNVGAIAKTAGSVNTDLIANKAVTRSKVADEIVYMPEAAIDTANTVYMTKANGGIFNWLYGIGYILELDKSEYDRLETFWETIMFNSTGDNMTLKFTNLPAVYDTRTGNSLGGTSTLVLSKFQAVKLKKIAETALLILSV